MTTFSTQRQLNASPAEVFAAIQNPQRLARWWGPNGFTNRFELFEFQTGGRWVFEMIGPDGSTYANTSVFKRITPHQHVLIQHDCAPFFELSIRLEAAGNGTLLHWDQTFADAAVAEAVRHIVEPSNEQNLDRLATELNRSAGRPP